MSKKLIYLIAGILSVQLVTALYGGETWTYHFPYCNELEVDIEGNLPIEEGEYKILNNCTETSPNNYVCNCSNDYYFNVSFKTNTLNFYTFKFNYDYLMEVAETVSTGGTSGSSGYSSSWVCGNWSECIDNRTERVCWKGKTINHTQFKSCVSPVKLKPKKEIIEIEVTEEINLTERAETLEAVVIETKPTKEQEKWVYIGIILITVLFAVFCAFMIKKSSSKTNESKKD